MIATRLTLAESLWRFTNVRPAYFETEVAGVPKTVFAGYFNRRVLVFRFSDEQFQEFGMMCDRQLNAVRIGRRGLFAWYARLERIYDRKDGVIIGLFTVTAKRD